MILSLHSALQSCLIQGTASPKSCYLFQDLLPHFPQYSVILAGFLSLFFLFLSRAPMVWQQNQSRPREGLLHEPLNQSRSKQPQKGAEALNNSAPLFETKDWFNNLTYLANCQPPGTCVRWVFLVQTPAVKKLQNEFLSRRFQEFEKKKWVWFSIDLRCRGVPKRLMENEKIVGCYRCLDANMITFESLSSLKPSWDISTCTIPMSSTNLSQTQGIQKTFSSPTIPNKRNS